MHPSPPTEVNGEEGWESTREDIQGVRSTEGERDRPDERGNLQQNEINSSEGEIFELLKVEGTKNLGKPS